MPTPPADEDCHAIGWRKRESVPQGPENVNGVACFEPRQPPGAHPDDAVNQIQLDAASDVPAPGERKRAAEQPERGHQFLPASPWATGLPVHFGFRAEIARQIAAGYLHELARTGRWKCVERQHQAIMLATQRDVCLHPGNVLPAKVMAGARKQTHQSILQAGA